MKGPEGPWATFRNPSLCANKKPGHWMDELVAWKQCHSTMHRLLFVARLRGRQWLACACTWAHMESNTCKKPTNIAGLWLWLEYYYYYLQNIDKFQITVKHCYITITYCRLVQYVSVYQVSLSIRVTYRWVGSEAVPVAVWQSSNNSVTSWTDWLASHVLWFAAAEKASNVVRWTLQ